MMTNSLPEALVIAVVSFIAGVIVGQFVRFRRVTYRGRHVLKPQLDPRPLNGRVFRLVVVVLFLAATALLVQFTAEQRHCNTEFRRTITERADATTSSDKALNDLVTGLLTIPQGSPDGREQVEARLREYQRTYADKLNSRVANPYPRC